MSVRNVIIAGGGTGGHIYPGIAVARAVERLHPDMKVHFVGAKGGLEEKIVPREGFPLHLVPVGKLHHTVGLLTRIKTVLTLPLAFFKAWALLRELKPVAVLGVGGFASGPMLFVSSLFGTRSVVWEPNAMPGMTNRMLARRVDEVLVVFDEARGHFSTKAVVKSGLPVRSTMVPASREGGTQRPLRILVFGGSQGARFINNLVAATLRDGTSWLSGVEVVHQTGPHDFARIKKEYEGAPGSIQVFEYLHDMDKRYAWADLVVCRAGASTVAEVAACQKAAIFIPLPTAADDHQRKNAEALSRANAAALYTQDQLTPEKFRDTLKRFRDDRTLIADFEKNVRQFQFPHADEQIVARLLEGATV